MMRVIDRYLVAFLGLIVLTGMLVVIPRRAGELPPMNAPSMELDGWVGVEGAPDDILPVDERAVDGLRRTYRKGGATVWLAVSRYPAANGPLARPALKQIAAIRGASDVTRSALTVHPNGVPASPTSVGVISFRHGGRERSVVYWYQLGPDVIADDYALRLRLLLDGLRMRSRGLVLVRVAANDQRPPDAMLRALLARGPQEAR